MKAADRLSDEKHFKWHKDMNILMVANFLLSEKMHDTTLLGAGIFAAIEAIMQAQQAAAIAAIAATTAASSSSAGS